MATHLVHVKVVDDGVEAGVQVVEQRDNLAVKQGVSTSSLDQHCAGGDDQSTAMDASTSRGSYRIERQ